MKPRAVIFDRDGVLTYFDTLAAQRVMEPLLPISVYALAARWEAFGMRVGFPRSLAEERAFFRQYWDALADEFGVSPAVRQELYALNYARFVTPYPEVGAVLQRLHAAGVRIGVLSNFSLASLAESLEAAGLASWIDAACAGPVIGWAKPARAAYTITLDALNARAEECLFFDDELACVEGARAVGMRSYLVDRRLGSEGEDSGPDVMTVSSLLGVPALFGL